MRGQPLRYDAHSGSQRNEHIQRADLRLPGLPHHRTHLRALRVGVEQQVRRLFALARPEPVGDTPLGERSARPPDRGRISSRHRSRHRGQRRRHEPGSPDRSLPLQIRMANGHDVRSGDGIQRRRLLQSRRFKLVGRCLSVDSGDGERTPVFSLASRDVSPSADGIAFGEGQPIRYGVLYALAGAVPGPRLDPSTAGRCARETLVIRSIERLENIPESSMPPLAPERR